MKVHINLQANMDIFYLILFKKNVSAHEYPVFFGFFYLLGLYLQAIEK